MSVYLARRGDGTLKSPFWQFDFVLTINGERRRFHGSSGERTKKAALAAEIREKSRLKSERPLDQMTLADACFRYDEEVGRHRVSGDDLAKAFEHCCRLIGGDRRLVSVTADDIANAVRRRSAETVGRMRPRCVTGATVNRQIVEPLRRLMRRARKAWGMSCDPASVDWGELKMRESAGRVRELSEEEGAAFWAAVRADYLPFIWFLANRGFRVRAAIGMKKLDVAFERSAAKIWVKGKGITSVPLSPSQIAVIREEVKKSPLPQVWTYETQRRPAKGIRRPITYSGLRRAIRKALQDAGITDFHIHDLRHDFASKLLRHTRNLKLVQEALGHSDIASTIRYAHVLGDEISAGMEGMGGAGVPEWSRKNRGAAEK